MRTTLTLDDEIAVALKEIAHERGKSFKAVVNAVLRAGLDVAQAPRRSKKYRLRPSRMGEPLPGFDLDRALGLADSLEDEAIGQKLQQRK